MCRLFGYVTDSPTSVSDLLGDEGLDAFTSLTAVHADGWGMAWHRKNDGTQSTTSPLSAADDARFRELARQALSCAGIVHLRWATPGISVRPENTHPFCADDYAFAHNGSVSPISDLENMLNDERKAALMGDTDSERYFQFLRQCIDEDNDEVQGVSRGLATLMTVFPACSLNALLLTPSRMFAIHVNSRAHSPLRELRALFDNKDDIPPRHITEYFAMDYRIEENRIEVISSGLNQPGWTPVPDDTAAVIDLQTREVSRLEPIATQVHQR